MKCPFRIKTVKGERFDKAEITQEFEECYGESCAAARIVEYNIAGQWTSKVEGCYRLTSDKSL